MRYLFITFYLLSSVLYAIDQEDKMLFSEAEKQSLLKESKTISKAVTKDATKKLLNEDKKKAVAAAGGATSDIMIVDPKNVSHDWVDAFNTLRSKNVSKLSFTIKDRAPISNITNVEALPGGYLMLFTTKTVKGLQYQIVKTSNIISITS